MRKLLFALSAIIVLASCQKVPQIVFVNWSPTLDESALGDAPVPESYKVTLTNLGTEEVITGDFVRSSPASFSLVPGIYNVTVQAHGSKAGKAYNYIGSASSVDIKEGATYSPIKIAATAASALLFKEIHYNASMVTGSATARYLKDTFFEIYNNSEVTVYADGLCIGDPLSCQVYDFSASIENPEKYVFIGTYIWQVPGSGTDFPVAPGESIIIAASAIDHSKTANTLDLSTAEFETICDKYKDKGGQVDANAINMILTCTIRENGLANQFGKFTDSAWVIFFPSQPFHDDGHYLLSNHANNYGQEVLKSDILDAIDLLKTDNPADKRLETELDAGWIRCTTTGGNQSVVRKIAETTAEGRIILQDTNNTTEDFEVNDTPQIRRYGAGRPSWSTWTTAQ
ncbi:MAG: DUF4876 domain-containing protein [Bacteroidales bacterium]|nr:DUF4876 domain-containing protein [Bacteroidales bacterium]